MTHARRHFIVHPEIASSPEIGRALWMLEDARHDTEAVLDDLDDPAVIDWQPDWALHSIGTLLYHIALVEADWLHVEVRGNLNDEPYPDATRALFPYPMRTAKALTRVSGLSLDAHRERLATIRSELLIVFAEMKLEDFRQARNLPDYDVTPEWVLHHLGQHEAEHRSEIAALRSAFKQKKRA